MRPILPAVVFFALAGVAANTQAGFKAASSDVIAPDLALVSAEFGTVKTAEDGTIEIIPAGNIPLVVGQTYGWRLHFRTTRNILALREELILPAEPKEWGSDGEPEFKVSPDGKIAKTEGPVALTDGMIQHSWSVAPGDPSGGYEIRVFIEGQLVRTFKFKVEPPKP